MEHPSLVIHDLVDWIIRFATLSNDAEGLLDGVCRSMVQGGLPVWHASVAAPAIDPLFRGATLNWWRDRPIDLVTAAHGQESDELYQRSPIPAMRAGGLRFARWSLATTSDTSALDDLRRHGGTDYVMFIVDFAPGTALEGAAISFAADNPGGFDDWDIQAFKSVVPALGLAVFRQLLLYSAKTVLNSYLGGLSGAEILGGEVRRGEGRAMAAAILVADLRGFTAVTDREEPLRVVQWLNEHLEAIGEPVTTNGGEILKFLGDGLLAVFPASDETARPCQACGAALRAAVQALARNELVNEQRKRDGAPQLRVDIALHFGEVIFGNVGTAQRLDLTTIGRAVNEASRIEKLCDDLHHLLASATFTRRCTTPFQQIGTFELRGVTAPIEVFAPLSNRSEPFDDQSVTSIRAEESRNDQSLHGSQGQ